MAKIYTKTGDKGTTALFGGKRVRKDDLQVQAYGAVDELSSILGVVLNTDIDKRDTDLLTDIQRNLYMMMNILCGAPVKEDDLANHIEECESYIDELQSELPPLHRFVLPQGTEQAVWCHVARTTCRRAERQVVTWLSSTSTQANVPDSVLTYLNRLSDLLFMLSRKYNRDTEVST